MTHYSDLEGLPRLADKPRNPARIGYAAILLTFGGLGTWGAMAPLDSATVAAGQVAIESDRKPIQHLEGGIVREILVKETEHVEAGQVLFRLEPVQALANLDGLRKNLDEDLAQEARLVAERDHAPQIMLPPELVARRAVPETAALIADQQRQFTEHRQSADNDVSLQNSRIDQAKQDIAGKQDQADLLRQQLESYTKEFKGLATLTEKGYYPRNKLNALDRDRLRIAGELQGVKTDMARSRGAIGEAGLQIRQIRQHYVEDAALKLADIRVKIADIREKMTVAHDIVTRQDVRAPRAGIIQGIKVHTVGAVLRPGDTIAELVTIADRLIMTAHVLPANIQNVQTGQRTEVRFPTLSQEQKRPAYGRVESISADLIVDETTHQGAYDARVVLDPATLDAPLSRRLVPGMPADLIIINGERTALDYIFEPILSRMRKSLREK